VFRVKLKMVIQMKDSTYKLIRSIPEILHPSISKKNISLYEIIIDEELFPIRVYYPKKMSELTNIVLFLKGNNKVTDTNSYSDCFKNLTNYFDSLILSIEYNEEDYNKIFNTIKYIYKEFEKINKLNDLLLAADSTGASLILYINDLLEKDNINFKKTCLFYPCINGNYFKDKFLKTNGLDLLTIINLEDYYKDKDISYFEKIKNVKYKNDLLLLVGRMDPLLEEIQEFYKKQDDNVNIQLLDFCGHGFLNDNDPDLINDLKKIIIKFLK